MPRFDVKSSPGLYEYKFYRHNVTLLAERVSEHSDRISAEITIKSDQWKDVHRIVNLAAPRTMATLAQELEELAPLEGAWLSILADFSNDVMARLKTGQPVVDLDKVRAKPTKFLVDPFVLENQITVFFGPGGSGKSYFAQWLSLLVQNGLEVSGVKAQPGNVLYLDWETDADTVALRQAKLINGIGQADTLPRGFKYRRCYRSIADDLTAIGRICIEEEVRLLVIDSFGMACGGNIREEQYALRMFQALRELQIAGVTIVGITHVAKDEMAKDKASPIGSVYFINIPRMLWEIRAQERDSEDEALTIGIFQYKSNETARLKPRAFSTFMDDWTMAFEPADVKEEFVAGKSQSDRIVELIREKGKISPKDLADWLQIAPAYARVLLHRLAKRELVTQVERGQWGLTSRHNN